jgi:glutamate dehydrogenase/leucine dehydrogenase
MVYSGLDEVMSSATQECIDISFKHKVDLRTAAYLNAIFKLNDFF